MTPISSTPQAIPATNAVGLQRNLNLIETWGFGLTGLLLWLGVAPGAYAELGHQALWVWIPGALIGVMVNLQVRCLGASMPDVAGGTPNYTIRLLPNHPWLTRYAAIGYWISWVAVLPVNAIILTDLVMANLDAFGLNIPEVWLRAGFTVLAFIVAFSGSHALGTLHLVFLLPAVGFLLLFCVQGGLWRVATLTDWAIPSVDTIANFSVPGWAKWYLSGTYAFYACETAATFVADSKRPKGTLKSLWIVAALIPIVYIGGSWVLMHLAVTPGSGEETFSMLRAAATPFWGQSASLLVTFLITSSCLLACATAVAICPRVLYQLAQDQHLAPMFGITSRQGVFGPGLWLTLLLSLGYLVWGNVHRIVMVTSVGWLLSFIVFHWGVWHQRRRSPAPWPWVSLAICGMEILVLLVGGWAWSPVDLVIGLALPGIVLLGDRAIRQLSWPIFQADWWVVRYRSQQQRDVQGFIAFQVFGLILFICGATLIGWFFSTLASESVATDQADFVVVLILILSFIGVAIACWTVLPQILAVNEAREQSDLLSKDLQEALVHIQQTQTQMVQQEKMSSLGQLVAGVAHEINNPINFIHGNLNHAQTYARDLLGLVDLYQRHYPQPVEAIQDEIEDIDLEFLQQDLPKLLSSMELGTTRIRKIVLSLRNFSRMDEAELKAVDLHEGIESTLLILQHRFKARVDRPEIKIHRDYGDLPLVECYSGQLNQVFMNILANGIEAIEEQFSQQINPQADSKTCGQITIHTSLMDQQWVKVVFSDSGPGIPEAVKSRIFDPFFTTKPIGKGTGMGMSISYAIVTEKHQGKLECFSQVGTGTDFVLQLPIRRPTPQPASLQNGQAINSQALNGAERSSLATVPSQKSS